MACRDGFWKTRLVKQYFSMVVAAKLVESWAEFFGALFPRFGSVLESLSVVCVFLLSSLRFHIVVSDGASISFWKISGEKFELISGRDHGHENSKIWWKNWNLVKFCGKPNYLRNWFSGGFETSKSTRVLRCAQYSGFRRSHVHDPWVVVVTHVGTWKVGG